MRISSYTATHGFPLATHRVLLEKKNSEAYFGIKILDPSWSSRLSFVCVNQVLISRS